ncbi:MAG: TetR/AcrR family transcriptional regulator [Oscillospiraceae bacterium]|nr:TetR/AcrR family transcriptional regulator [Oscillospiraceae bacterium]
MARSKEQGERMREATREKILEAATILFAEKGLAGTSTKDIAQKAGVSVGLMYHYYKTKDDMFRAIEQEAVEELDEIYKGWGLQQNEAGIRAFAAGCIEEMQEGLGFAAWVSIVTQSADFSKRLIAELSKAVSPAQAQFFVAILQGVCGLQLTLKDAFQVPSIELMTSYLREDM